MYRKQRMFTLSNNISSTLKNSHYNRWSCLQCEINYLDYIYFHHMYRKNAFVSGSAPAKALH